MSIISDINYLEHIICHCQRLENMRKRFGDSFENLKADEDFRDLAIQQVTQIGENINSLSAIFKQENNKIPWRDIIKFRNDVVHKYRTIRLDVLYSTITELIPMLKQYCEEQLTQIMTQQASEETGTKPPRPRCS
jgi:uncharacterized protein with HEPN domain